MLLSFETMNIFYTYFISTHYTLNFQWKFNGRQTFSTSTRLTHTCTIPLQYYVHHHTICFIFSVYWHFVCDYLWNVFSKNNFEYLWGNASTSVCMLIINPSESKMQLGYGIYVLNPLSIRFQGKIASIPKVKSASVVCRPITWQCYCVFTVNVKAVRRFINGEIKKKRQKNIMHIFNEHQRMNGNSLNDNIRHATDNMPI